MITTSIIVGVGYVSALVAAYKHNTKKYKNE